MGGSPGISDAVTRNRGAERRAIIEASAELPAGERQARRELIKLAECSAVAHAGPCVLEQEHQVQRICGRRLEVKVEAEATDVLGRGVYQQNADAYDLGCAERTDDRIPEEMRTETMPVLFLIDGQPTEQDGRDGLWRPARGPGRGISTLDAGCGKGIVANDLRALRRHVRPRAAPDMVHESIAPKPPVQRLVAAGELRRVIVLADRPGPAVAGVYSSHGGFSASNFSSRGLCTTGRSSSAWNSFHAASSSMNRRLSARTSRACSTVASTVKSVTVFPFIVVPGAEVPGTVEAFHRRLAQQARAHAEPPESAIVDFPDHVLAADSVAIHFVAGEGLSFYPDYHLIEELFSNPARMSRPRYRETLSGFLRDSRVVTVVDVAHRRDVYRT